MLSELKLKNFKSIAEAGLSLSTVTVLIGENGSGKSSFVQSLAVLKQSLGSGQLSLHGPIIDVGSFDELLHQPAEEGGEIAFELAGEARYGRPIAIEKSDNVAFEYAWAANATSTVRMHHGLKSGQRFNIESAWSRLGQSSVMPPSVVIDGLAFAFGVATGIGQGIVVAGRGQQRSDIDEATSRRVEQSVQSAAGAGTGGDPVAETAGPTC